MVVSKGLSRKSVVSRCSESPSCSSIFVDQASTSLVVLEGKSEVEERIQYVDCNDSVKSVQRVLFNYLQSREQMRKDAAMTIATSRCSEVCIKISFLQRMRPQLIK